MNLEMRMFGRAVVNGREGLGSLALLCFEDGVGDS